MRITSTLLLLLLAFSSRGQKAEQMIDSFLLNHPQEKVVLALDKNAYLSGETMLYKAYLLHGYAPAKGAANLYVELYNSKQQRIDRQIVPIKNGSGEGSFALAATLNEDTYFVRAYTTYLLNFDESFQCLKAVNVFNPASPYKLAQKPVQWTAAVFPEGGTLVDGVPTTVVVRLLSQGPVPDKWQATLETLNGKESVASVDVLTNELGVVRFLPVASADYVVKVVDNSGQTQVVPLPKPQTAGTVLQAWTFGRKLTYNVHMKNLPSNGKGFKIIGTSATKRLFTASVVQSTGVVRGEVSIDSLENGVVQLQLLDDKDVPLNNRLCFVQQTSVASPSLEPDTLSAAQKALNSWKIRIDTAATASYRVQVMDATQPFQNEFLGDVYLTADFPGVRNAWWYFENSNQNKLEALDALLITETWKRFDWAAVLAGQYKFPFQPDSGLRFMGTAFSGKKPAALQKLNLVFQGNVTPVQIVPVRTDSSGQFSLETPSLADSVKVFFTKNNPSFIERSLRLEFKLKNSFAPLAKRTFVSSYQLVTRRPTDTLPERIQKALAQHTIEKQLRGMSNVMEEVIVQSRLKNATKELERKLVNPGFTSPDARLFDFINTNQANSAGFANVLEWLNGRMPGYSTRRVGGNLGVYFRGNQGAVYLNEMRIDPTMMDAIPMSEIALIKVFRAGVFMGQIIDGAVAIYTKRGDMVGPSSKASMPTNWLVGYATPQNHFTPDYAVLRKDIADQREFLFTSLNPELSPGTKAGRVRFYNSDTTTAFRLIVTGFTGDGRIVFLDKRVE